MSRGSTALLFAAALAAASPPLAVTAKPGMTWAQAQAWLAGNPAVLKGSVRRESGGGEGPGGGRARVLAGSLTWVYNAPLGSEGRVLSESYLPEAGGAPIANVPAVRALLAAMYGPDVENDFAGARLVASVPTYGSSVVLHFYRAVGAPFGFELDTQQVTVYAAADLAGAVKQAIRCAKSPECGE
jgi:hypothetical protein